jgi:hypothetical protein
MGLGRLREIAGQLVAHGRAPETPAAVIATGTTRDQVVAQGTLAGIADRAKDVSSPATIVVGEVVRLRENLAWFDPASAEPGDFAMGPKRVHRKTLEEAARSFVAAAVETEVT